ncbi:hypothetical protein [Achromobacter dolens]|uniref:hypothetical protein n=1 Tax=Achromobacter dolens TaxID=1287738 RepID=UPI00300DA636
MASLPRTPGPWEIQRGYSSRSFIVRRLFRAGRHFDGYEYLQASGKVSFRPGHFRSHESAQAAIDRAAQQSGQGAGR